MRIQMIDVFCSLFLMCLMVHGEEPSLQQAMDRSTDPADRLEIIDQMREGEQDLRTRAMLFLAEAYVWFDDTEVGDKEEGFKNLQSARKLMPNDKVINAEYDKWNKKLNTSRKALKKKRESKKSKSWFVSGSVGVEDSSNVIHEPDGIATPSNKKDYAVKLSILANKTWKNKAFGMDYNIAGAIADKSYSELSTYDVRVYSAVVGAKKRLGRGGNAPTVGCQVGHVNIELGGSSYKKMLIGTVNFAKSFKYWNWKASVGHQKSTYDNEMIDEMQNGGKTQVIALVQKKFQHIHVTGEVKHTIDKPKLNVLKYKESGVSLKIAWYPSKKSRLEKWVSQLFIRTQYNNRDYQEAQVGQDVREDNASKYTIGYSKKCGKHARLNAGYYHKEVKSNITPYDENVGTVGFALTW